MDQSPFGIVIYRADGSVAAGNAAMQRLYSMTDEEAELVGSTYNILEDPQLEARGIAESVRAAFSGRPSVIPRICYEIETRRTVLTSQIVSERCELRRSWPHRVRRGKTSWAGAERSI